MIIEEKINELLMDPNFIKLSSLQKKSNLFSNLAVSHLEMWHSAFVKWLIDPQSDLGLGTFPLKRFLYMVIYQGRISSETEKIDMNLAQIENLSLEDMQFVTEEKFGEGRLDILGMSDEVRIIIENKIKANEGKDQTNKYWTYGKKTTENFLYDLYIFLSPDESQIPKCSHFIQITYQDLNDYVIRPCINHPEIKLESKFLLEQYTYNLRKPLKNGGKVMALANKELCKEIYEVHREALEEIFLSVKGEAPELPMTKDRIKTYTVRLEDMIEEGLLNLEDILVADYKGNHYKAELVKEEDGIKIRLMHNGNCYGSVSKAASAVTEMSINGWVFWNVQSMEGINKGKLRDLRSQLGD